MSVDVIIVMGVSGSGKTTIAQKLADRLGWQFADADDFHPPENVEKMSAGMPLNDNDRAPWLQILRSQIDLWLDCDRPTVLACSALKSRYRCLLGSERSQVQLVYLKGEFTKILQRMQQRDNHFMKPEMLRSQFDALEEPEDAIAVDIGEDPDTIVDRICQSLS